MTSFEMIIQLTGTQFVDPAFGTLKEPFIFMLLNAVFSCFKYAFGHILILILILSVEKELTDTGGVNIPKF